jgi:glucose-1-phosphatase
MDQPARPEPVEALLFDLGGVVLPIDFRRCFQHWADCADCDVEDIASQFYFDHAYEEHERGRLSGPDYFASVSRLVAIDLPEDDLITGWNSIYGDPDTEVLGLLARASDRWPLYAFTNSNPTHQAYWTQRFAEELKVFDTIFVSSELGHRKPDRAAFDAIALSIGTAQSRILFFDDTLKNVEGARAAGMQAVHVTSAASVRNALHA